MTQVERDTDVGVGVRAGLDALAHTADQIARVRERARRPLAEATRLVLERCDDQHHGHLLVTGLGKSGLIGSKLAATFASTGTVSHFVHAADALHGDAGMVSPRDVLLAISNSGATPEVVTFAGMVAQRGVPIVALTGCDGTSPLAELADVVLDAGVDRECDPDDLAPTASTSVCLALGDALAVALLVARGFEPDDFARFHPGGALGARLTEESP